jgi:hypothetical protein
MGEWPKRYHPARYEGTEYVVDTSVTVQGYQLRPDTWRDLASWSWGDRDVDPSGNQCVKIGNLTARLGDFVMYDNDGVFHVEPADGHYQRWAPA